MVVEIFLFFALVFSLFYGIFGDDIYGTHEIKNKSWTQRGSVYMQRYLGSFVGWMTMWFLLDRKLDIFCHMPLGRVTFVDFLIFIVALIGIFGLLPVFLQNLVNLLNFHKKS